MKEPGEIEMNYLGEDAMGDGKKKEDFLRAHKKFELYGELGVTRQDHHDIGSSPPKEFKGIEEGKTQGEVMIDEQILNHLEEEYKEFKKLKKTVKEWNETGETEQKNEYMRQDIHDLKIRTLELERAIRYFKEIGKLPAKFSKIKM